MKPPRLTPEQFKKARRRLGVSKPGGRAKASDRSARKVERRWLNKHHGV